MIGTGFLIDSSSSKRGDLLTSIVSFAAGAVF